MRSSQLHEKITRELQRRIVSGELKPGDLLPSEVELCEEFEASRGPVRQAIASLRAEGLVSSGRGRRSIVLSSQRPESFMSVLSGYTWMQEHGLNPTTKLLWMARCPAPAHVAEALGQEKDDPIIFVSRVLLSKGNPEILERLYFPLEVGMHVLAMDPNDDDIHRELIREGVDLDSCIRDFEVIRADRTTAELLDLEENAPLIASHIRAADSAGVPLEYAEYLCSASKRRYHFTVVKGEKIPLHSNIQFESSPHWSTDDDVV